ncbi:MAG: magnesium transporter CorA family protein [Burkholderiaceae bacterium]
MTITAQAARLEGEPQSGLPARGFLWIDVISGSDRQWATAVRALTATAIFDEHLTDSENAHHPSFFDSTQRYEMIVFRGLVRVPDEDRGGPMRIRTRPVTFFVLPGCLVTIRPGDSRLFALHRERLLTADRAGIRLPATPEELMFRLLSGMVDRYLELRQPLTEELESLQRRLLNPRHAFRDWAPLLDARTELRRLQNLCEEQLDAIQEWRDERSERADADERDPVRAAQMEAGKAMPDAGGFDVPGSLLPPLSDSLAVRATDVEEHVRRVLRHAAAMESSVESAIQLHFSATSYRTAEIMRVLTVITAIFMPLTLITGIFGMNFEFLPGIHSRTGFYLTLAAMGLIAAALIGFFGAKRYLETSNDDPRRRRRIRAEQAKPPRE